MAAVTILQISDLHRDPQNPIRNDALLTSLDNDRARYLQSNPAIPSPDILIVSGDIIQGAPPGTPDYQNVLAAQHREALDFLGQLADRLVHGNRQRVVIIPGNHDVSACHAMESFTKIDLAPNRKKDMVSELFSRDSPVRWSWSELEFYKIDNPDAYARRFEPFAAFYEEFYGGTRTFSLDPAQQFDVFDYPEFGLTIVGFSSCFNNDILNRQAAIHPGCIGAASARLRDRSFDERLRVAVWHHNTEGLPMQTDYMDAGLLQFRRYPRQQPGSRTQALRQMVVGAAIAH